jgi:hypothetical protein
VSIAFQHGFTARPAGLRTTIFPGAAFRISDADLGASPSSPRREAGEKCSAD